MKTDHQLQLDVLAELAWEPAGGRCEGAGD
jgi:hypothetical protein